MSRVQRAPGNRFSSQSMAVRRAFHDALKIGLPEEDDDGRFRSIVDRLIEMAALGDIEAMKVVFDRVEGKPMQSVMVGGDAENPLRSVQINASMSAEKAAEIYRNSLSRATADPVDRVVGMISDRVQ